MRRMYEVSEEKDPHVLQPQYQQRPSESFPPSYPAYSELTGMGKDTMGEKAILPHRKGRSGKRVDGVESAPKVGKKKREHEGITGHESWIMNAGGKGYR